MRRLAALVLIPVALAVSSCSGGDDKENVQQLLDKAFAKSVQSADLKIDAELQVQGVPQLDRPIRITANGPFKGNENKLPSTNIELNVGAGGGGQTVSTGFLSTGDRAFVKFQDVYYEQPRAEVAKANRSLAQNESGDETSLKELGLDPRRWLTGAQDRGEEKIAGVDTTHISGRLDVNAVLKDLNNFVRRQQGAIGGATGGEAPKPLSAADIKAIEDVVKDPTFEVYVGKDDDIIRRVSGRVEVEVPEQDRGKAGEIQGGSLQFSVELGNVNGDQKVEAPAKARPIADLTRSLGPGGLGGITGQGGQQQPQQPQQTPTPTPQPTPPAGGGQTAPAPDAEAFQRYADCLEQARPDDSAALQRCAEQLQE